jgi:hypothetical protein
MAGRRVSVVIVNIREGDESSHSVARWHGRIIPV